MSLKKKILLTLAFVLATLVVPAVVLLLFVDALNYFAVYVVAFGIIIFLILGFIVISLIDIHSTLKSTVEELKMQNAAIAYKLTNASAELVSEESSQNTEAPASNGNIKVNLNPAEPLVMPAVKKQAPVEEKKSDDGFDDFQ